MPSPFSRPFRRLESYDGVELGDGLGTSLYFIEMFSVLTISQRLRTRPVRSSHSVRI